MASGKDAGSNGSQKNAFKQADYSEENPGLSERTGVPETGHRAIDRMVHENSNDNQAQAFEQALHVPQSEAMKFASRPLSHDVDDLLVEVEGFISRGYCVESIYVDLLAQSARTLGAKWESDECDFVDVTMGLWRLQEVMRELAVRFPPRGHGGAPRASSLFTPVPGDQHSFGALMIDEIFGRAGWDSEALIEPQRAELLQILAERSFDLVGLTVSNDCPSGDLANLVSAIRSVSRCRTVKIILGGHAINSNPGLVGLVGADGTAADARSALVLAERIVLESNRVDQSMS